MLQDLRLHLPFWLSICFALLSSSLLMGLVERQLRRTLGRASSAMEPGDPMRSRPFRIAATLLAAAAAASAMLLAREAAFPGALALAIGVGLAAVCLAPTWRSLKSRALADHRAVALPPTVNRH